MPGVARCSFSLRSQKKLALRCTQPQGSRNREGGSEDMARLRGKRMGRRLRQQWRWLRLVWLRP
jgi:hypothetical protein